MNMFKGEIAQNYDGWYRTSTGYFIDYVETRLAFELFQPLPDNTILDAGCGTGNFSMKLAGLGCQVTGIDISHDMLQIAERKNLQLPKISYRQMDLYDLDFPDSCFDGVFSMAAFEFVHEPQRAFDELYRVLKPGGKLLIGTINGDSPWGELYKEMAENDENSVFRKAHFIGPEVLARLNPGQLLANRGSLFIPPGLPEEEYNLLNEEQLQGVNSPGFIMALWQKG